MSEKFLELIKTRTIFLNEGLESGELVLVDDIGGDMYFTFLLRYVPENSAVNTHFEVIDSFHARMTVETRPNSFTQLNEPLEIGTYQQKRVLYMDVAVEPCLNQEERKHRVTVSFYTDKEKEEGNGTQK